jgi:predicted molibdopterin-dependent oxidoreductase YjgC
MTDADADVARIRLTIDGRRIDVAAGTTVAAALVAAGVQGSRLSVGGEPRSALCGMGVCQECRVTIDGVCHRLACQTLCADGMNIRTARSAS